MQMTYSEVPAPDDLRAWVASFWSFEVDADAGEIMHTIPLTGGAMLSLAKGELFLVGPRAAPLSVPVFGGEIYRGIHFLPGATTSLFGVPAPEWRDLQIPARFAIDPAWCDRLRASYASNEEFITAATQALRELAATGNPPEPVTMRAVAHILLTAGSASIAEIAEAEAVSPRHLRRLFSHHVGLSPKELARIVRLRAAATAAVMRGDAWAEIVADHGFADQPHLVREFQSMLGATPARFGRHARRITHRGKPFE